MSNIGLTSEMPNIPVIMGIHKIVRIKKISFLFHQKWTYLDKSGLGGRDGFLTDIFGIVSELLVLPRAGPEVMK